MGKRKAHQMSDGDSDEEERSPVAEAPKRKKSKTKLNANESNALISPESLLETADEVWIVKVPKHVNVDHLHDQKLPFSSNSSEGTLTLGDNLLFTVKVEKKKAKIPFQLPGTTSERPTSVSVKGEITLVESVTVPEVGAIQVPPFEVVQQPKSFVRRHPFHGVVKETTPATPTPYVTQDEEPQAKSKKSSDKKSKKKKKKSKSNDAD